MSLRKVADTFPALQPAPTDSLRRLVAVLVAPIVKPASVKPASFRMAGPMMVDAAGAVVRFFLLHDRLQFVETYSTSAPTAGRTIARWSNS